MPLTPLQRKLLVRYRDHRERPFTVSESLLPLLPTLALSAGLILLSVYVFPTQVTVFIAGLLVGVFLRNVALVVHGLRVIPALLQVIDWKNVDRLLGEHFEIR